MIMTGVTKTGSAAASWAAHSIATLALLAAPGAVAGQETVTYYTTDAIGSVRMVTDSGGAVIARYDYRPFGDPCGSACGPQGTAEKRQFAGTEKDAETGLDYFGARYYAVGNGRFTTVDPFSLVLEAKNETEFVSFLSNPQQWNRYSYALNNPHSYIDPDGRAALPLNRRDFDRARAVRESISAWLGGGVVARIADAFIAPWAPMTPQEQIDGLFAAAMPAAMVVGGGAAPFRGFLGTTLTEAKSLVGAWGKGTFGTLSETISYHFGKHGSEVGAKDVLQYLRKAFEFNRNLRGAVRKQLEDGAVRYEKNGWYIINDSEGRILSYGMIE